MKWNYKKFLRNMLYTVSIPALIVGSAFILAVIADWLYNLSDMML